MSSIGSGPGISAGAQLEVNPTRPVSALGAVGSGAAAGSQFGWQVGAGGGGNVPTTGNASAAPPPATIVSTIVNTGKASAGSAPVDTDRVTAIRKAIQHGSYPLVPTEIGAAMIAAGMILRIPK